MHFTGVAILAAASLLLVDASPVEPRGTKCHTVPYVIYAAGTQQSATNTASPYPTYSDSALSAIATSAFPSAVVTALPYPAAGIGNGTIYYQSWHDGTRALQSKIEKYLDACPNSDVVLLGYSQGASVVVATLGGFFQAGYPLISPLKPKYHAAIIAGALFADPSFQIALSPLDYAASKDPNTSVDGTLPNGNAQEFVNAHFGRRFRTFCESGDAYCANAGEAGLEIHYKEETYWHAAAVEFLKGVKGA